MNDDEDEIDIFVERREAVTKRLCAVMGWEYGKKPIWAGLRKIALAEATAVGIDRLEEIVTALEAKEKTVPTVNFERAPSNEQTLLSELGEARATIFEMTKVAIKSAAEYVALEKERNGLRAAYNLQLKGMESMAELQDGLKQQVRTQAEQIRRLRESLSECVGCMPPGISGSRNALLIAQAIVILRETAP